MARQVLAVIAIASATTATAAAQPGQTPPAPYPPPGYHLLSAEERALLARGEIGDDQYIGGGLVGIFVGFGVGHLVQGRYGDKGWIFTVGEAAAVTMLVIGLSNCYDAFDDAGDGCDEYSGWLVVGAIGGLGFRIWELIDLWAGPPAHNARVREIRYRAGLPAYGLFAAPSLGRGDAGGVAGLALHF